MENEQKRVSRAARLTRHVRRNLVGYVALFIAVSMTPLPSYAAQVAIGTSGIKNGAVTTPKLANGAVKAHKLGANSVNSSKIQDGKIQKVDLAVGARGFTKIVTKRTQVDVAGSATSTVTVTCDAGQVAIGGGAYTNSGLILGGGTNGTLERSHPTVPISFPVPGTGPAANGVAPTGWRTVVTNTSGDAGTATHYAMCAAK